MDTHSIQMTPVVLDGQTVRLALHIYRPALPGPRPTLVFQHGSTGAGTDPQRFTQSIDEPPLAQFFVQQGWTVVLPARRGRDRSEGIYDEGFEVDRAQGYTCDPPRSLAGADRALRDIRAAMEHSATLPFVDRQRIVIGGQSRGGILSVAYAGMYPEHIRGVLNFVGGWLGMGCATAPAINHALFQRGASYPHETLWLYGDGDPFYPVRHSRDTFATFQHAGGTGTFHVIQSPDGNGHHLVQYPAAWGPVVRAYLARHGLPLDDAAPTRSD